MYEFLKKAPESSSLSQDVAIFKKYKVFKIPEIRINKEIYKGSWNAKYVFDAICIGLRDGDQICKQSSTSILSNIVLVFGSTIIISLVAFIGIISYRKMVNRNIDRLIMEKIETQSLASIGEFQRYNSEKIMGEKLIN